jgi:hypothetical protein
MTSTTSTTRTYAVGDTVDEADYTARTEDWCRVLVRDHGGEGRGSCSMLRDHKGPQHVAATTDRVIVGIAPRDTSGDGPRLYAIDDVAPGLRAGRDVRFCSEPVPGGWVCSLPTGHTGPQHLCIGEDDNRVIAVGERDTSGDSPAGTDEPSTGPTWNVGDHVQGRHNGRIIASGVVLGVAEVRGVTQATIVGRNLYDSAFQLMQVPVTALVPLRDSNPLPTQLEIAAAVSSFARQANTLIDSAQARAAEAETQYEQFRDTVRDTATDYAKRHGWCSVVDQALEEIGLEKRARTCRVRTKLVMYRYVDALVDVSGDEGDAWRRIDELGEDDFQDAMRRAGESMTALEREGWTYDSHDSDTSGVSEED